jgi:hypothetical protein
VVGVSFEEVSPAVPSCLPGTGHPDPRFRWSRGVGAGATCCGSDLFDAGVVVLDEPVDSITPASLPTLGWLNELHATNGLRGAKFVTVGYGATADEQPGFAHCCPNSGTRRYGVETFRSLDNSTLHLSRTRPPATAEAVTATPADRTSSERRT